MSAYTLHEMHTLSTSIRRLVAEARADGVAIDAGNIVDLCADNLPETLEDIRYALALCPELPQPAKAR